MTDIKMRDPALAALVSEDEELEAAYQAGYDLADRLYMSGGGGAAGPGNAGTTVQSIKGGAGGSIPISGGYAGSGMASNNLSPSSVCHVLERLGLLHPRWEKALKHFQKGNDITPDAYVGERLALKVVSLDPLELEAWKRELQEVLGTVICSEPTP